MKVLSGVVQAVCLSVRGVRVAKSPVLEAFIGPYGFIGDRHEAELRRLPYGRGAAPNQRQWSAVSDEEVSVLCADLGVEPFAIGALGENLRLSGLSLGDVPRGAVVELSAGPRLRVTGQNDPCLNAAKALARDYGEALERSFIKQALGRRGLIGSVIEAGPVRAGDTVRVLILEPGEVLPAASVH